MDCLAISGQPHVHKEVRIRLIITATQEVFLTGTLSDDIIKSADKRPKATAYPRFCEKRVKVNDF